MNDVDLSGLRIDSPASAAPRRPLGPRLLAITVVALTLAVVATFVVPWMLPPRAVRMARIHAVRDGAVATTSGANATAEAVGWVEADPFPTIVRPLVNGHIETLEVLEGAQVVAGETVIARLASAELQAAKERATALVLEQEAALGRAEANHALAKERLEQNADNLLRARDAATRLAGATTSVATAVGELRRAEALAASAAATRDGQQRLAEAGSSHPIALAKARADADAAAAEVATRRRRLEGLQQEHAAAKAAQQLADELTRDPVDLRGALAIAAADVRHSEAQLQKARTELAIATRELDWAVVRAPVDGVVLRLEAQPGDMVGHGERGIVALYDPQHLRARIDVPLDSLAAIHAGQRVEVTSEAIGDVVVHGVVQRLQHESDLLKNTLQVKVGLTDAPSRLRPETLCRARFLATDGSSADSGATGAGAATVEAFRVPREAVRDGRVFVFDPSAGIARAISVEVVGEQGGDAVVRGQLSATQRVVLDAVTDGETVREAQR